MNGNLHNNDTFNTVKETRWIRREKKITHKWKCNKNTSWKAIKTKKKRRKKCVFPRIHIQMHMCGMECGTWSMRNEYDTEHTFYADHFESIQVAIWYDSVWKRVYRFRFVYSSFFLSHFLFSHFAVFFVCLLWLKGKIFSSHFLFALNFIFNNVLHTMNITLTKIRNKNVIALGKCIIMYVCV